MRANRLAVLVVAFPLSCQQTTVLPTEAPSSDAAAGVRSPMPPDPVPGSRALPEPTARPVAPMPWISRGLPSFSSHGASSARHAFDADYATEWRSAHEPTTTDPDWIALD